MMYLTRPTSRFGRLTMYLPVGDFIDDNQLPRVGSLGSGQGQGLSPIYPWPSTQTAQTYGQTLQSFAENGYTFTAHLASPPPEVDYHQGQEQGQDGDGPEEGD